MLIKDIVKKINKLVSNNTSFKLDYERLRLYIDGAVDHINTELLTEYKTPQEVFEELIGYYSALYNLEISSVILSNTTPDADGYMFNTERNMLVYNGQLVDAPTQLFPYIYVIENMGLYAQLEDGSFEQIEYSLLDKMPEDINYTEIPDRYIRSCVAYYAAALYLEEEDELESQYYAYKSKADAELKNWKKQYYSMYECRW